MKANLFKGKQADTPQLYDCFGPRSYLFFHLARHDTAWLELPVQQWDTIHGYQSFKLYISSMNVLPNAQLKTSPSFPVTNKTLVDANK